MRPLQPSRHPHRRRRIALAAAAFAVLLAPMAPGRVAADRRYDPRIRALQAQAATLAAQLRALEAQQNGAAQAAIAVQGKLAATQASLSDAELRLDRDNIALATTAQRIRDADASWERDHGELTRLVVRIYKLNRVSALNALLDSRNMYQLIDTALNFRNVSGHLKDLVRRVGDERSALATLRSDQEREGAAAATVVSQLHSLQEQQRAEERQFEQEVASLSGQAALVAGQSRAIVARIAAMRAQQAAQSRILAASAARGGWHGDGDVLPPFAFGPREDDYPWGQCTWYVASLRDVSWGGDAWMWMAGARAQGMSTGMIPRRGAIVVWGPGNGYSGYGHVAYVVDVQGPSDFTVDEANYDEVPGDLDRREIGTLAGVEGFIY